MNLLTIIGARPQIIKAAAISREIIKNFLGKIVEKIVHTGQHYDDNMSQVFFDELGIPRPDYNLNTGSGSHGEQTAAMLSGIAKIIEDENPNCVVVYGDTNSTLAAAIAASKLHIPIAHVEAGLRSFNKKMPEEINRIVCDHVSTFLFTPTETGMKNLAFEGFPLNNKGPYNMDNPKVYHCGDVMYDNSLYFSSIDKATSSIINDLGIAENKFILVTLHRNNNTDEVTRISSIIKAFLQIAEFTTLVIPLHPRTKKMMNILVPEKIEELQNHPHIKLIPPASFLDMVELERYAEMIITDSGGVQKEAFYFKKPCIIMRPETEWVELVENGNAKIADANTEDIIAGYKHFHQNKTLTFPNLYGDGTAANFICNTLLNELK